MYNFDEKTNRLGTSCLKWDFADKIFRGTNLLPMWIADMDFKTAPGIQKKIQERLDQGIYGYGALPKEYHDAVISWMKRRHHCDIEKEWICFTPGVVSALNFAVTATTEPGEEVIVMPPVYDPFYHAIEDQGRKAVRIPLVNNNGYYTINWEQMEQQVSEKTKAILFCSPHNPVGRVWDREELERLVAFAVKHDLVIIDDEIHHDLVYKKEHIMLCRISEEAMKRSIICTAPSKTFNIAGIQVSNIIIPDPELRAKYRAIVNKNHAFSSNSFAASALIGAYNDSEEWLDELLEYLKGNIEYFCSYITENIPELKVQEPEGTYLVWVDCSGLGMTAEELKRFFVEKCGIAPGSGAGYGEGGESYMRFNLGCPRAYVEQALQQIKQALFERTK